jgi:hypothetical protein
MKRIHVIVAGMLLCTTMMFAQSEDVLRPNGRPAGELEGASSSSSKKARIVLGVEVGMNMNFHGQGMTMDPVIENSPEVALESGTGFSPEFGVFADFGISSKFGIQVRAAYDAKAAGNAVNGIIDAPVSGVEGFAVVPMETTMEYALSYNTVAIAALARIDLTENFFLTIGPIAQITMGDVTREDVLTKISDDDTFISVDYEGNPGQYDQISRTTTVAQNLLPAAGDPTFYTTSTYATTRFGAEIGLGYRVMLNETVYLAPNLRYQYMFSPLNDEFTAEEISQPFTQSTALIQYDKGTLNTLAFILQLGFTL